MKKRKTDEAESRVYGTLSMKLHLSGELYLVLLQKATAAMSRISILSPDVYPREAGRNFAPVNHPAREALRQTAARVMRFHFCPRDDARQIEFHRRRAATSGHTFRRFCARRLSGSRDVNLFPDQDSLPGRLSPGGPLLPPPALIDPVVVTALINFIWTLIGLDEFLLPSSPTLLVTRN